MSFTSITIIAGKLFALHIIDPFRVKISIFYFIAKPTRDGGALEVGFIDKIVS